MSSDAAPMRILVIDDSVADFYLIERALGERFTASLASTLASGLEAATRTRFDLVILDLSLDDSYGYPTFERAQAALAPTPIVILSGSEDEELALRAVADGAQDFVRKSSLLDYPLDRTARYAIERHRAEAKARKAELKHRALLDNLPTAAYTCDPEGRITYYNQKAVELWGRKPRLNDLTDRFCGSSKLFAADGTLVPHDQGWMAKALRERQGFNARETSIERDTGERVAALAHANPVLDENGKLRGAVNVLVDISSQRRTERELREKERFARSTVNALAAHIAILDPEGVIVSVNAAWERFAEENGLGANSQWIGTNYLSVCEQAVGDGASAAQAAVAGIRQVLRRERRVFEFEYPCHSPSEERWFTMRATRFEGEGPTWVVISHENITSRKIAERLASERCGLQEAVAGMEQVLGVVGHELRTPLAALRAISEFLTTDGARDTAEADRFLHEISEEVERMSNTVNNLLEAARLNSGRARWNWSEIDLAHVVADAIETISPLMQSEKVRLISRFDRPIGHMHGDAEAICRLLINLLSNARKHTTEGRIEVFAKHFANGDGSWVEFVIRDTGAGIPPEMTARLGEAFALNSGVVGRNHVSGTGLGLAICKGIATAHGGELHVDSIQGKGTTVRVRLRADLKSAMSGDTVFCSEPEREAA